ncbi:MAG: hypothetical protein ACTS5R_00455 [Candidatus Hodgkinia cicadicola]
MLCFDWHFRKCFGCLSGSEVINGEEASNEQSEDLLRCNDVRFNRKSGRRLLQCWRPRLLIRRGSVSMEFDCLSVRLTKWWPPEFTTWRNA